VVLCVVLCVVSGLFDVFVVRFVGRCVMARLPGFAAVVVRCVVVRCVVVRVVVCVVVVRCVVVRCDCARQRPFSPRGLTLPPAATLPSTSAERRQKRLRATATPQSEGPAEHRQNTGRHRSQGWNYGRNVAEQWQIV